MGRGETINRLLIVDYSQNLREEFLFKCVGTASQATTDSFKIFESVPRGKNCPLY